LVEHLQEYRLRALKGLTTANGVYALCDLDGVPIFVGQSTDGIRQRAQRHLTSARSDQIANRQIDVWEIAEVRGWAITPKDMINEAEWVLFHQLNDQSPLMNGTIPPRYPRSTINLGEPQVVQVLPNDEIALRKQPKFRLSRQIETFQELVRHILEIKDTGETRRSLKAYHQRLTKYYDQFLAV
jgi:hypothetical protein